MLLALVQDYARPPSLVWSFITEPSLMNRWTRSRVHLLKTGDGASSSGIGAVRQCALELAGVPLKLDQVIEASRPPHKLAYRVFAGLPISNHLEELTLEPRGTGTRLRWDITFDLPLPLPKWAARVAVESWYRARLDELTRALEHAELGPTHEPDADAFSPEVEELFAAAELCLGEQWALAATLISADDPKHWFAVVYAHVTEAQLEAVRSRRFPHPDWVLRMIQHFHHYYAKNLHRWIDGAIDEVEPHWRTAFEAMHRPPDRMAILSGGATRGLLEAVRAHVDGDLPRALAEVYLQHYADRSAYGRFRVDYTLMADIFPRARGAVIEIMPRFARSVLLQLPTGIREALASWIHYDVPGHRRRAFERGEQLAALGVLLDSHRASEHFTSLAPSAD